MHDIVAFSTSPSFTMLNAVGIKVYFDQDEVLKKQIIDILKTDVKIIIYDFKLELFVEGLIEKYDDRLYPIFLKLPTGDFGEDTLKELKIMIEKSIGISII